MNDNYNITNLIVGISPLKAERWRTAWTDAEQTVRALVPQPAFENYLKSSIGRYPGWVTRTLLIGLAIIALGALWISAGKQMAATDLVLRDVVSYGRVGTGWLDISLLVVLVVGEVGALTFSFASAIFASRGRFTAVIFRAVAFGCAGFALLGNISLTARHPDESAVVFQWFLTISLPLLVLAVGYFGEMLLLDLLEQRVKASATFHDDMKSWQQIQERPELHPKFTRTFRQNVIEQLRLSQNFANRKKLEILLEEVPDAARALILREYARHEMNLDFDASNPMMPEGNSLPDSSMGKLSHA